MQAFKLVSFGGSVPRRERHHVPVGQASEALDCQLWHGSLDCWREPLTRYTVPEGTKTTHRSLACCVLTSQQCAFFAEGDVLRRDVFATGVEGKPFPVRLVQNPLTCEPVVRRLGLPCPEDAPTADTASTPTTKAHQPRQYAYAYRDSDGNQSSLSAPSDTLIVPEGQPVQVAGWSVPATWDIQTIAIYRNVVGFESPIKEADNSLDNTWMLVGTVPATATSFTDTKFNVDLGEALVHDVVEPPPEDLWGLTWVRSMNCLAGFRGRELWFSENGSYHNWPYRLTLDHSIKAIVESNGVIYVATTGRPYYVQAKADCKNAGCREAIPAGEPAPLVGNGWRSMIPVPGGAVYPSKDGLVYLAAGRLPDTLTNPFYAPDDWQKLIPESAMLAYHDGRVFCFCARGAFCVAIKTGNGSATEFDLHTSLSLRPDEVFTSEGGRLMMRFGSDVKEWNAGARKMPHRWVSGLLMTGVDVCFGAAQVTMEAGPEQFKVMCNDEVMIDDTVAYTQQMSLPRYCCGQTFSLIFEGTGNVKRAAIAPSTKELV